MNHINVSQELKRISRLRQDRVMLDDLVSNYDQWINAIANINNITELESVESTLEPAFKVIQSWNNDSVKYNYLKKRIEQVRRLKSVFDRRKNLLSPPPELTMIVNESLPDIVPNQNPEYNFFVPTHDEPNNTVTKSNWSYQPTLSDLLNYYQSKGVVGEETVTILQTLGAINQLSFGLESLSGSGKSYVVEPLLGLLPSEDVYRMELSSKTAEMYNADKINECKIIYIPELQKAMKSNNPIAIELLKGLTEGKDVTRKVRNQSADTVDEYIIKGDKGIIFTLAVENVFKYDAEFSRRVFILNTDISENQTDIILRYKASQRHAISQTQFDNRDYELLASHVQECMNFSDVGYENPFADYLAQQIPRTIRARSYDDYLFDLMDASAKFHFKNRMIKDDILFLHLEDVYTITQLYWDQFCKGLLKIPVFGEQVMDMFDAEKVYSTKDIYHMLKEENSSFTFSVAEKTLESLVDAGFLMKDDYKTQRPVYSKVQEIKGFESEIDWRECWQHGYDFVLQHYPNIVDNWLVRQKVDENIIVFDPWLRENVTIVEGYENGTI